MADPVTILKTTSAVLDLSKAAWKLENELYRLYKDTQHVDETVRTLEAEIKALANACDLICVQMQPFLGSTVVPSKRQHDQDGRLWQCLSRQVDECNDTLSDLQRVLDSVAEEGTNVFAQMKRQIRLNTNKDNIERI